MSTAWTFWLSAAFLGVVFLGEARRGARLSRVRAVLHGRRGRWLGARSLLVVGAALVVSLALRDASTWEGAPTEGPPGSVVLAIDVSRSMSVGDGLPDRMAEARLAAQRVLMSLSAVRVGVVAFASRAHVVLPPTTDLGLVGTYLDALDPEAMSAQGSDLASAIDVSLRALVRTDSAYRAAPRGIVVFSDGESFEGEAALGRALARARAERVPVHVVGVGREQGGVVPGLGNGSVSRADPGRLSAIARATGGNAVFRGSGVSLASLGRRLDSPATARDAVPASPDRGPAPWLAALTLVVLAAESVLGARTRRLA